MSRMQRALAAVLAIALLAGCSSPEQPPVEPTPPAAPTGPPPPPPPPSAGSVVTHANDAWRYRGGTSTSPEDTVVTITAVANGTVHMRSVTTYPDNRTHVVTSTLVQDTLALATMLDDRLGFEIAFEPPLSILIPAADHLYVGNITIQTPFGEIAQPATATIRFLGLETATVPAGAFETYRYNATLVSTGYQDLRQESEIWFSPAARQAVKSVTDGQLQELVGYELS